MRWVLLMALACGTTKDEESRSNGDTAQSNPQPIEGPLLMAAETTTGELIFQDTTRDRRAGAQCLTEVHPNRCAKGSQDFREPCLMFGAVHEIEDGEDILTISYTMRDSDVDHAPGAMVRLKPGHPPQIEWIITQLSIPSTLQEREGIDCEENADEPRCHLYGTHIAVPDPSGEVIVADTSNSRILWVTPPTDGSETGEVKAVLSQSHPDWDGAEFVNHIQRIETEDATWLLATFKGQKERDEESINMGRIMLWDITDRSNPASLWSYPGSGNLAAVHHASMHETPKGALLLYAHSLGNSATASDGAGSVGIAQWNGSDPPIYLADGLLAEENELGFVRSVAWNDTAGAMLITDSGCEHGEGVCERDSAIMSTKLPTLDPPSLTGAWTEDGRSQNFLELRRRTLSAPSGLQMPFSSALFDPDNLGPQLGNVEIGRCP